MRSSILCRVPITSSAAAEGVGARRSATKSAMVKSVSWPTAEITGTARRRNGPRHALFVERPQIFERPSAARDDHHFRPSGSAEIIDARRPPAPPILRPAPAPDKCECAVPESGVREYSRCPGSRRPRATSRCRSAPASAAGDVFARRRTSLPRPASSSIVRRRVAARRGPAARSLRRSICTSPRAS